MHILELRKWEKRDGNSIAPIANNSRIAGNLRNVFPNPYTLEDANYYVESCMNNEGKKQITRAIVVNQKTIGSIGIFVKDDVYEKSGELGYWLAEEYWGQGIMSSAVKMICKEAFVQFDLERIFAEPFETNVGSRRVLEKSGFTYEGTMRNGVYKRGKIQSYCMYSILKKEVD